MAKTIVYYRLYVRNRADDDDLIILSSKPGEAHCLLSNPPEGDGQTIDPLAGSLQVGTYTWTAIDAFESGLTYTLTSIIADEDARNQWLSNKCIAKYSTDLDPTWRAFHTGFLNDMKLGTSKSFTFIIGDTDRKERQSKLFQQTTDTIDTVSNILGGPVEGPTPVAYNGTPARSWGPVIDYGPARFIVITNPSGLVNPTTRVTLSLVGANLPPLYLGQMGSFNVKLPGGLKWSMPAEYIDKVARRFFEWDVAGRYKTNSSQQSQPWGSFPQLEVKMKAVSGGAITKTFPIAQATKKATETIPLYLGDDYAIGDYSALVANSNDWLIVDWDTATMGAQPSVGTTYDVWVRPKVIDKDNPLHLQGHPIDIHRLVSDDIGIPYDDTSADATKTALGDLYYLLWITDAWEYAKFTEMLKGSAGYAVRYNGDAVQEFFQTRMTQPASVDTIDTSNTLGDERGRPREIIFRVAESTAVKGVDFKLKQFRLWSEKTDSESDRPIDGVIAETLTINGARRDDVVQSDKIVIYDVPGMIMLSGGAIILNQPLALRNWIIEAGNVIIDRAGWGWPEGEIKILNSVIAKLGEYLDVELPHQINAKIDQDPITQRGGTRRVQIVSETKKTGYRTVKVRDAGNLAQTPPSATDGGIATDPAAGIPVPDLLLSDSTENPTTVALVTLDNIADFDDLNADTELQYLIQDATPASTDNGTNFGPLLSSTGDDTILSPNVPTGQVLWVRGRGTIPATGQKGAWSTWTSWQYIDDTGAGGTLPLFSLALAIDGSGVLSASASSVDARITKIYFLAGAVGGAPPLYADVIAETPDSSAPFEAASLATMDEGDVYTVGAIGEDALGNRTLMVTATATRGTTPGGGDPGVVTGTPGNWSHQFISESGSTYVFDPVPAVTTPLDDVQMYRKTLNPGTYIRGQATVKSFGNLTAFLDLRVSLDDGTTWETDLLGIALPLKFKSAGPHVVSFAVLVPSEFEGDVLLHPVVGGGDGATVCEIWNFMIESTSVEPPPATGEDEPYPGTTALPTGGAYGSVILDLNPVTQVGFVANARVIPFNDDSSSNNDGITYTTGGNMLGGEWHTNGWNGGSLPFVRAKTSDYGWRCPSGFSGAETNYFLISAVTGAGTTYPNAGRLCAWPGGSGEQGQIDILANGHLYASAGASVFGTPQAEGTHAINDGNEHLVVVIHSPGAGAMLVYVDGVLDISLTNALIVNGWTSSHMYFGAYSADTNKPTFDFQRGVRYNAAHSTTEIAGVTAAIRAGALLP
jgi:hypothetical protein